MYHSSQLNSMQQPQDIETVPHITDHQMILDTLPHPLRSPIRTLRTFFGIAILAGTCIVLTSSLSSAAELYPFTPPSFSQQRSIERQPAGKAQLSTDDEKRVSRIATQAKQLSPSDRSELKSSIQKNLNEAAAKRNLNQVKYFSELLRQIE